VPRAALSIASAPVFALSDFEAIRAIEPFALEQP
jgi:hypothetical protein